MDFPSVGETTCDNLTPPSDRQLSIEARLIKHLRTWREVRNPPTAKVHKVDQEILSLLEWFICQCLPYGPSKLGGWWSDGVVYLEIHETATEAFQLLGVTWIGCQGLTPFEIDVELNPTDDQFFSKTVFRIGMLDDGGTPRLGECREKSVAKLLAMRPQRNRDWAMAVELTPR